MNNHRNTILMMSLVVLMMSAPSVHADYTDLLKTAQQAVGDPNSAQPGIPADGSQSGNIADGLKEALQISTQNAVTAVSRTDGYYNNPDIKIPLPAYIQKIEGILRSAGFGATIDKFLLSMNRAAEKAAYQATSIFVNAIKEMTISDAQRILNGRNDEATRYFRDKTSSDLQSMFKPAIKDSMAETGVTRVYQDLAGNIQNIPFTDSSGFDLDSYVTEKAVDGLFVMIAAEEAKIRKDPAARVTDLLKSVFGSR